MSQRADRFEPFALERFFARYEFTTRHVLCASDCESMTVAELLALDPGAAEALQGLWLGYTESAGHPALREAIAGLYAEAGADDVLVHVGAQEIIFNLSQAVLAPGDHVVVQTPCYQSLRESPRAAGCCVTAWPTREADGWRPSVDELAELLQPNTRAIVLNQPHNPTGGLLRLEELEAIVELARARGALLVSDEVYRGLELDPVDRLPPAVDLYERAVSIGVTSKSLGLAGLRIGWLATRDAEVMAAMAAFKDYTTICASAPSELLATVALRHHDALVARSRDIVKYNYSRLDAFVRAHSDVLAWTRPAAGPVAFPRFVDGRDAASACAELVEEHGVLVAPGTLFGDDPHHFRLGLGRRSFPSGLAVWEGQLAAEKDRRA